MILTKKFNKMNIIVKKINNTINRINNIIEKIKKEIYVLCFTFNWNINLFNMQ